MLLVLNFIWKYIIGNHYKRKKMLKLLKGGYISWRVFRMIKIIKKSIRRPRHKRTKCITWSRPLFWLTLKNHKKKVINFWNIYLLRFYRDRSEFDPQRVENAHLKRLLMINSYWYKLYLSTNLIAKGINAWL